MESDDFDELVMQNFFSTVSNRQHITITPNKLIKNKTELDSTSSNYIRKFLGGKPDTYGHIFLLAEWASGEKKWIPREEARQKAPSQLREFYESIILFETRPKTSSCQRHSQLN